MTTATTIESASQRAPKSITGVATASPAVAASAASGHPDGPHAADIVGSINPRSKRSFAHARDDDDVGALLGTNTTEIVENARKSSPRRSPTRVCYTELLHNQHDSSPVSPRNTVINGSRGCYTNLLHNLPVGMSMRGTRYYHRRRLPNDVRRLLGKAEIWKSLHTDSLTIALRRLPAAAARIERRSSMLGSPQVRLSIKRFYNR